MATKRDFLFSCNVFAVRSRNHFVGYCQDAERYGYDTVVTADHLGSRSVAEIAAQLPERRGRFGFSYNTVHEPYMATLAPVIEQLR